MNNNRELPQWSQNLKKWMGENGAMTNLQKDFIFHIEDSLIQPLKKSAVNSKKEAELMKEKNTMLRDLNDRLIEEKAALEIALKSLRSRINQLEQSCQ